MNTKLLSSCVVAAALFGPVAVAVHAADGDVDRAHPAAFVKDSVITTKVKAKLAEDKMRSLVHVHVDTDASGRVVLSGDVESKDAAARAASIARETEGVKSVENHIKIKNEG